MKYFRLVVALPVLAFLALGTAQMANSTADYESRMVELPTMRRVITQFQEYRNPKNGHTYKIVCFLSHKNSLVARDLTTKEYTVFSNYKFANNFIWERNGTYRELHPDEENP